MRGPGIQATRKAATRMDDLLRELRALESELHHPGAGCSRERLEALLHPGFHEVGRSGRRYSREVVIAHLASQPGQPDVVAADHAVHLLAEGCALLTYRSSHRAPDGTGTLASLRSSVWLRTAAGWQLFYHQGTPGPAGGEDDGARRGA